MLLIGLILGLNCFPGYAKAISVAVPDQENVDLAAFTEQLKKTNPIVVAPLPPTDSGPGSTSQTVGGAGVALGKYYLDEYVNQKSWWLKRARVSIDGAQFHNYNGNFSDACWQFNYLYPIQLQENLLYYSQFDFLSYDSTLSAGFGVRKLTEDSQAIFGAYLIDDFRFGGKNKNLDIVIGKGNRFGFGLEYFVSNFEFKANTYLATGGGDVANGIDIGVQYDFGWLHAPWLSIAGEYYSYSPQAENVLANNGVCALLRIQVTPKIRIEIGRSYGLDDDSNYYVASYNLVDVFCPALLYSNGNINETSATDLHWKMDQPVDRSYVITSAVPR
ncbi:MAG: inverse autotransporter beta domain-containing protein [Bacillota bacterium]